MYEDFIAGWAAGGAGLIIGHPMDTIKARLQTMNIYKGILLTHPEGGAGLIIGHPMDTIKARLQTMNIYKGIVDCAVKTVKQETIFGLYKGMLIPFISAGAMHSILFAGYGFGLKCLHPEDGNVLNRKDLPMSDILLASIFGTMVQVGPMIPVELLKTKLQVQRENVSHFSPHAKNVYSGPVECFRDTLRTEGVRGLFKGGSVVFCRDNIGYLFYIPVYEGLIRSFHKWDMENMWTQLFSGGCAGVSGWISVCPLEVVKNRIQVDKSTVPVKPIQMARQILKTEGLGAFYRGGWAISIRGFTVNSVIFVVYEKVLEVLGARK